MFLQELLHTNNPLYDGVSGKQLNPELVAAARADEIRGAEAHQVWSKAPAEECFR